MFTPLFESKLRNEEIEGAVVVLSDYDDPLWDSFGIETVPTVAVFKDGEIVCRRDGRPGRGLSREVMLDLVQMIGEKPTPKAGE